MQEKDIRKKLNQELEEMAPELFDKICAEPIEPVKNERELFGKNKPLFKEEKKYRKYLWSPIITTAVACIAIMITLFIYPQLNKQKTLPQSKMAFSITIDVNPSISIEVDEDGKVKAVKSENKDAKKIVEQVNEKIKEGTDYNKAVELVMSQLDENGYLKKKKNAMLVSVVSEDKDAGKETLKDIKNNTKKYQEDKDIKCTTVYQNCVEDDKVKEVAKKNNVSVGKAAFCMKIAEKENASVKKMCKESIATLVEQAEKNGAAMIEEIEIIKAELTVETEKESFEETTASEIETETVPETSNIEESTAVEETATIENESGEEVTSLENNITEQAVN